MKSTIEKWINDHGDAIASEGIRVLYYALGFAAGCIAMKVARN